jgi:catechol 2,3-dioxygenase-like lactoylglutathione lyase family enzyme
MSGLDQVTLTASDFPTSLGFYDAVLGALGLVRLDELVDEEEDEPEIEVAAWGQADGVGVVWLATGPIATTGAHLRLRADSRRQVETFYQAGLLAGGTTHAAPRRWAVYRRGDFNAIVVDPDGNLIEAVAAE